MHRVSPHRLLIVVLVLALGLVTAVAIYLKRPPSIPIKATAVSAGAFNTCALLENGDVKCWGTGNWGQLGQGHTKHIGDEPGEMGNNLPPIDLGTGRTATQISVGALHVCALLDDGTVKCWGRGTLGQLGQGTIENVGDAPNEMGINLSPIDLGTGQTALQVSAGGTHTCAILDDGMVKCWGSGGRGQLGQGHTEHLGDEPGEMGDNLSPIDLGTGRTALQVSAGDAHSCALLDDGTVKCWGSGAHGQLGQGTSISIGKRLGEMGNNLPPIDLGIGRTVTQISTGGAHSCALLDDHTAKCWGGGFSGRLGQGHTRHLGNEPNEMGNNLPPINLGTEYVAIQVQAGGTHVCALFQAGSVKCWGQGSSGQLGHGKDSSIGDAPGELGDHSPVINLGTNRTALQISTGEVHTCALLRDGVIKCWGQGFSSQLGQGHLTKLGVKVDEMGNNLPPIKLGTHTLDTFH